MSTLLTNAIQRRLGRTTKRWSDDDLDAAVRHALDLSRGDFGAFVVLLLLQGIDLPICGSERSGAERRYDPVPLDNYLAPLYKTMMLASSRYAPLPCEVAFFARHYPDATPEEVWRRAYKRGGGAA